MKRKKLLLTLLGVLLALPALARDFTYTYEGQTLTYTVIDEEAKTCKTKDGVEYTSSFSSGNYVSGTLIIPSVAKDGDVEYTVTALGKVAFGGELTSVTIPESVTTIGKYAFRNCDKLTSAEFASIEALCGIDFANLYSNPLYVAHHLYIAGKEVTEVVIPNTVSKIGDYTFSGCSSLTSVTIPESVTTIGYDAFRG
ncbi:MAG: leucine-rich repeat domain-containing protein, partial [Duncaniella sp.]|nr:leucine-rich repeat domain-containing protein [Duncaniella sp.]